MRTITVEEHYATAAFMDGPGRQLAAQAEAAHEHPQVAAGYAPSSDSCATLATAGSRPWTPPGSTSKSCR
jgi:hypothetical protein